MSFCLPIPGSRDFYIVEYGRVRHIYVQYDNHPLDVVEFAFHTLGDNKMPDSFLKESVPSQYRQIVKNLYEGTLTTLQKKMMENIRNE